MDRFAELRTGQRARGLCTRATEDKTIHFNQFEAGTSDRIRNRRVNERTGDEVDFSADREGLRPRRGRVRA